MKAKKSTTAVCAAIGVVLLLLTAFSGVDAWEQEEDGDGITQTVEQTAEETAGESADGVAAGLPAAETASEETTPEGTAPEAEALAETDALTEAAAQAAAEDAEAPAETETPAETDYFAGQFIVTVTGKTALNVREEPNTDSRWVGKMYDGSGGFVLEEGDGWTKIQSGKVTGWVSNDYILTGEAGREKVLKECELVFEVESDALKVRSAPTTTEDNKLRAIYGGESYLVVSVQGDWVEIEYSEGKTGWVAGAYGTIRYDYDDAMSRQEIEEAEAAKKRVTVTTTTRAAQEASVDDLTLLACLVQCESGSYEGQLAVANVVLNRVNSSKFPNTISDVIYAAGQFGPVKSGKLAARLEKGPSATALQAATDALSGVNNIGNFVYFRSAKSADLNSYSSYTIVAGNCFYSK